MKNTSPLASRFSLPVRLTARKTLASALLVCAFINAPAAYAKDPCKTVLCMFGKFTGNSGGSECQSAEADYFSIVVKKKKGRIDWDATASDRKKFLDSCPQAEDEYTKKINDVFGKLGG